MKSPRLTILGGPNGAGKTTLAESSYADLLETDRFLNADIFAAEAAPDAPSEEAFSAGRRLITLRRQWIASGLDFVIESTLATRTLLASARSAAIHNYRISLIYLWVSDPDICIQRVAERVNRGGHYIPTDVIKRRYTRSLQLLGRYIEIADDVDLFDASGIPELIARKRNNGWRRYGNVVLPNAITELLPPLSM